MNNLKPIFVTWDRIFDVFTKIWEHLEGGPSDGGIQASSVYPSEYFINIHLFRVFQNHRPASLALKWANIESLFLQKPALFLPHKIQ